MNPAFSQQAMLAGGGMPPGGNVTNQLKTMLFQKFQHQQGANTAQGGWQASLSPAERVQLVMQLSTSLGLAQPAMGNEGALKGALQIENERYARCSNKDQYLSQMRAQLQQLQQKRLHQSQNMSFGNMGQMGNMGNPQTNMPGMNGMNNMMGQPMQNQLSNQGAQMPSQFNPQLSQQMRVSQLPMNNQNPQGLQNGGMNQAQGAPNPQQATNNNQAMMNHQQTHNQKINLLMQRMMDAASQEQKAQIMQRFQSLTIEQQNQLRARQGDPLTAHFRAAAQQYYTKLLRGGQAGQNGLQNNMMGQGQATPLMQRNQPQLPMGQADGGLDFSQFMNQQQDAIRSADNGQLVVPASNNAQMNQIMNGMPTGLAGAQMGAGMNSGNPMQAILQNRQNAMAPQQQAAARLQRQMVTSQGLQNGQGNQQMPPQQHNQSPMPQMSQPGMPNAQRPQSVNPQQRPTPVPTPAVPQQQSSQLNAQLYQIFQAASKNNGVQGPIRRPLPPNLPPSLQQNMRNLLQTCSDEHYNIAIEQVMKNQVNAMNMQNSVMQNVGGQQNQAMMNEQTMQQNMMRQQQLAAQERIRQQQVLAANQRLHAVNLPPELMQQMDQMQFPRTILNANGANAAAVPPHVMTWMQLKEWVMRNPAMAGNLTVQRLMVYQTEMWKRNQTNQMNRPMNAQMNNGAPAPAPTAQMVPPGVAQPGMPGMGQQQPPQQLMNAMIAKQLSNVTVTPEDIQNARAKNMLPAGISDQEAHSKILTMKRQQLMQRFQQQHRAMAMQNMGNQPMGGQRLPPGVGAGAMPQPPQRPQQTPQMNNVPAPNQQNKQQPQRPTQANSKTPQQQNAKKRPAPDEIIEIQDGTPASQAPGMQVNRSQQGQPNEQGSGYSAEAQALNARFLAICREVKEAHQPRIATSPLTDQERQQLNAKVQELKQIITRTEWAIRLFFQGTRDEDKTRVLLRSYYHMVDNVNPKEAVVLGQATARVHEFDQIVTPMKNLVVGMMKSKQMQAQNVQGAAKQAGNNTPAQQSSQQLNAANLEQHNTNLRQQAASHRRSSSKAQVPSAPTMGPGQNPFDFNHASPQGVPKYADSAIKLTPDNLKLPRKKPKKDGQPPSGQSTPAQTGVTASPQVGKAPAPQIKRQPSSKDVPQTPQPPKNPCQDLTCEFNKKGFKTPEELHAHMRQMHAPPADPLKFAMETLATSMGLNADGTVKVETESKPIAASKTATQVKAGATPPAGVTPLNKIPMKGSPAMDRLKTPQHSSKPPAPTSASATLDNKTGKQTENAVKAGEHMMSQPAESNSDPWKDSAWAQNDLLEWLKPYDTFTGDWGNDRALRSPQLTPATTPDTNVTDKTASTRDSEILEADALNMTLAMHPFGDNGMSDFMMDKDFGNWEPNIVDPDLMNNFAYVGIEENMGFKLEEKADISDWDALFGPDSNGKSNAVPGWENVNTDMVF